ncbi:MAG: PIN domain-containing protein [Paracoccaceae bacterium]|uniref:PIN domain-containing protein n=1 Tax=Yoonia sp. TaxID=2212373 RepID=UPI00327108A8
MPIWETLEPDLDLPRNLALLDTNVLLAYCNPSDKFHEDTVAALDIADFSWAVTRSAVIETSSFLTGSLKRPDLANTLMEWIMTPGQLIRIGETTDSMEHARHYARQFRVDFVDATLLDLANQISTRLELVPAVHVATYDTGDFLRMFGQADLNFHVYDMRDLSSTNEAL